MTVAAASGRRLGLVARRSADFAGTTPRGPSASGGRRARRVGPPADRARRRAARLRGVRAVRVRIPAIGVDSSLGRLDVDAAGALVPPTDFARAGWFAAGPVPGDVGPSVIAGHVDSHDGPAVFFRLAEFAAGDEILVERADGTTARFTVSRTGRYPKNGFPTQEVYGPRPAPSYGSSPAAGSSTWTGAATATTSSSSRGDGTASCRGPPRAFERWGAGGPY